MATTLSAKRYVVLFVNGEVGFIVNGKYIKAVKDEAISDNWILQMDDHSTLVLMGQKKHKICYTNNIKGKKLKDVIGDSKKVHFWDYPSYIWAELREAVFHSDPEVKNNKLIRVNGNSIRGDENEEEVLDEFQLEYKKIIEKALEGE
jgi:hypothetical protein